MSISPCAHFCFVLYAAAGSLALLADAGIDGAACAADATDVAPEQ